MDVLLSLHTIKTFTAPVNIDTGLIDPYKYSLGYRHIKEYQ
jgi:hypothetical protein